MDHENVIRQALRPYIKAEARREEVAGKVYDAIEDTGTMLDSTAVTVEVPGARVAVKTVKMGGLTIRLDVSGNAVSVHHPRGLEVTEYESVAR